MDTETGHLLLPIKPVMQRKMRVPEFTRGLPSPAHVFSEQLAEMRKTCGARSFN